MSRLTAAFLLLFSAFAFASESPLVDERLAGVVEGAVKATGFNINISESAKYSVNINTINGRNVCDKEAAGDVKRFQEAVDGQPNVRNNYGPAFYSVTRPDGTRKILSPEQLVQQGVVKGCSNIYVSVTPK